MQNNKTDAYERIRQSAEELFAETKDAAKITVREIASRAEVGVGLINYYFGSKDALLAEIVADKMKDLIHSLETDAVAADSPKQRMVYVLTRLYDFGAENMMLLRFTIRRNIDEGDMGSALMLIPMLKEIYGPEKDEMQLRIIALQLLYPLQLSGIAPEKFKLYSGVDIQDTKARSVYVNQLIDNLM